MAAIEPPSGRSRAVAARYRHLAALVQKYLKGGRFLDFGCGDGQFLDHMAGFDGIGLDLRKVPVGPLQQRRERIIDVRLEAAVNSGLLVPGSFDFVTAWDLLEHLPRLSDDVTMVQHLLKPGGWLFCTVPNVASLAARLSGERWNCYLLEHLWYFPSETLTQFLESRSFVRRAVRSIPFHADIATLASRIAQTYAIKIRVPRAIEHWTVPLPAGVIFGAFQFRS